MNFLNTDNILTSSYYSSFNGIPDIYDLCDFKETNETINLKFIMYSNKIHKIYLDDIELVYLVEEKSKQEYIELYSILSANGIYDIKKYMFLENKYTNAYFTTDIISSSSIKIESTDIFCQKIRNKSMFHQILVDEIILYFDLNESNTAETYLNINFKEYIESKSNYDSNLCVYQTYEYNPIKDKEIIFFDKYNLPIFFKINIILKKNDGHFSLKHNKICDNFLDTSFTECMKIKNIILPLQFKNELGEVYCELYLENKTHKNTSYRLYFTKIILPNYKIINYRDKCQKCIKSKLMVNIFNEYDSLCMHRIEKINYSLRGYNKKIKIQISDLLEQFDKFPLNLFLIMSYCKDTIF